MTQPVAAASVVTVRIDPGCTDRVGNAVAFASLPVSWSYVTAPVNAYPPLALSSLPGIDPVSTTTNTADVVWASSRPAVGWIEWGKTTAYGTTTAKTTASIAHRIKVTGLAAATVYHGRACLSAPDQADTCSNDFVFAPKDGSDRKLPIVTYGPVVDAMGVVTWYTADEATDSKIDFGNSPAYGTTITSPVYTSEHHVRLPVTLSNTTPIHFRIVPTDVNGNSTTSGDSTVYRIDAGQLIKSNASSAVYFVDENGVRHPYPNESTYFSWETDFSQVLVVSFAQLAGVPLGAPVTIRPGTYLVKIISEPKTYAVTAGSVLHELVDEAQASGLYGPGWASRVRDVPDAFFISYMVGTPVVSGVHPDGTLILLTDGSYYLTPDGKRRLVTPTGFSVNNFNPAFTVTPTAADLRRPVAGPLVTPETLGWH
jgi:hypothetical protein